MDIQYTENNSGTNVFNAAMLVLVTMASSLANPFGCQSAYPLNLSADTYQKCRTNYLAVRNQETNLVKIHGAESELLFQKDFSSYYTIYTFAKKFLTELESIPAEFEELFLENFWDTLA